jgi:flavorubredoxin
LFEGQGLHGVILRDYIPQMVEKYTYWSDGQSDPNRAVIIFDTMWGATRRLAEGFQEDFASGGIKAELLPLDVAHVSTAMAKLLEVRYIYIGSPTLNRNVMPTVAAMLTYMKGLNPRNRVARAFGAYGWSGESVGQIEEVFKTLGYELEPSVKVLWREK